MQNSLLYKNRTGLKALCEKFHVRRLEGFGSAVREDFDPQHSDLDLLIEIDPAVSSSYFDDYFGLREELESLLERPVDLLSIDALDNPYFIERITNERETLYAA
jgi:predicted nucleotidyltransferase